MISGTGLREQDGSAGSCTPESPPAGGRLTVLVVDDQPINRVVLKAMLSKLGHRVLMAENGREAVEIFAREWPSMVLMDVMMPVMDGYEATRRIKALAGDMFVPVLFLTAMNDEQALVECIDCGGDDFLTKPYSHPILEAKIAALGRVRQLYALALKQKEELRRHHERLCQEHEAAERVFVNVIGSTGLDLPNVECFVSPMAIANGDLVLTARRPDGVQHLLIGDFTGHGLVGAVGTFLVADVFCVMTGKGFSIESIAAEVNRKLHVKLPTGHFCAACLVEYDPARSLLRVWNGGVPEILVVRPGAGIVAGVPSTHLPLAVVDEAGFDPRVVELPVQTADRVYLYTDGVVESRNSDGDMFDEGRLIRCIEDNRIPEALFEQIRRALREFRGGAAQDDDITMAELRCDPCVAAGGGNRDGKGADGDGPRG